MRTFITGCLFLIPFIPCLAQPAGMVAIEDPRFDAQFAQRKVPVVTGRLLAMSRKEQASIQITYTLVTLSGQVTKTALIGADGSFKLKLDYPLPYQQIWFQVGELFYAGLYADQDLHVELDIRKLKGEGNEDGSTGKGVRYLGTDGPLNAYMNKYQNFRPEEKEAIWQHLHQIRRSIQPVAKEVLAAYSPIFDSLKRIQDDYIARHPSPYSWLLENERLSEFYGHLCVNYWGHSMEDSLFAKVSAHKTYLVSNSSTSYYGYLSQYLRNLPSRHVNINLDDVAQLPDLDQTEKVAIDSLRATLALSPPHPQVVQWQEQLQPRLKQLLADRIVGQSIALLDSLFPAFRADFLKLQLDDSQDVEERMSVLARMLPTMRTNWCHLLAQTNYTRSVENVEAVNRALASSGPSVTATDFGKPLLQTAFGATLYKISAMSGENFLAKLRKSFAGKAIVLDRWATWCVPCLDEMPHSKKLQQDSKELPVVFVYVCTAKGSDEGRWKRKVADLKLPGVHFFIDEALDAAVGQYFSFSGYPGYALIDRQGVYKPGAITWISAIRDKQELAALLR
jgi:thiol-disulfide isomerase/thioredoxin